MNYQSFNVASLVVVFVLVCFLSCPTSGPAQTRKARVADDVEFSADVYSLKCGETTTLSWKVPSTDRAFILGVGTVPIKGSKGLEPLRTTTYSLLAEGPAGLRSRSIKIS